MRPPMSLTNEGSIRRASVSAHLHTGAKTETVLAVLSELDGPGLALRVLDRK